MSETPDLDAQLKQAEVEKRQLENKRLRQETERLKQEHPAASPWRSISAAIAALAAVVPISTAVHGYFQKEKEVELGRLRQQQEIQISYLDRVKDPVQRQLVLDFLASGTLDQKTKAWAEKNLVEVNKQVKQLQDAYDGAERDLAAKKEAYFTARREPQSADNPETLGKTERLKEEWAEAQRYRNELHVQLRSYVEPAPPTRRTESAEPKAPAISGPKFVPLPPLKKRVFSASPIGKPQQP